jgi:Domain of unknown function (DUF4173)
MHPQQRPAPGAGHGDARPPYAISPRAARAVLGLALLAGVALVGTPAGLGLTLVLLALGCAVAAAPVPVRDADLRATTQPPADPWRRVWWALAAALACIPFVRAATWVVIPAVTAAALLAAVAVGGRLRPLGALRTGRAAYEPGAVHGALPALRGAVIAAGLLALFVPLLVSADAAFAQLVQGAVPTGVADLAGARVSVALLVAGAGGALLDAGTRPRGAARGPRVRLGRAEWGVPLAALVAVLAAFVATQVTTFFGGNRHVLETAGLTYAEYARSGFAQMAVVAALALAVVAGARRYAAGGGRPLRALLAALCLLTLVVIASALHRLGLYEHAYGLTRLRLTADAILLWLGALFVLVLLGGGLRPALALTGAAVLAFALSNPDRRIAGHNGDAGYLSGLSADAVPVLGADAGACARLGDDGIAGLNLARHGARTACLP